MDDLAKRPAACAHLVRGHEWGEARMSPDACTGIRGASTTNRYIHLDDATLSG